MVCLRDRFWVSERRACRLTSQHRSSQRYRRRLLAEEALLGERLQLLARRDPGYGYRRIHAILRREGWPCNRKRVQRLWRDEGLRLPAKARRRRRGPRMPGHLVAAHPDQVWAIDFVSDRTAEGRPLKILTVTDEHTREALATPAARRMGADETVSVLEQIVEQRGRAPALIRCDNGPEFISQALRNWCRFNNTHTGYIEPGAPWQNPFVESFNAKGGGVSPSRKRSPLASPFVGIQWGAMLVTQPTLRLIAAGPTDRGAGLHVARGPATSGALSRGKVRIGACPDGRPRSLDQQNTATKNAESWAAPALFVVRMRTPVAMFARCPAVIWPMTRPVVGPPRVAW